VGSEHNLRRSLERVAEFEREPEAFAARYYRGNSAGSYPAQTTIAREREQIEYFEDRRPKRLRELAKLDRELQRVEKEVIEEVTHMRPSKGRVPWPPALPAFAAFNETFDADERRRDLADAAERERFFEAREEDDRRRITKKIRGKAEIDALIAGLPGREQAYLNAIRNSINEGEFTFIDFVGALQAKTDREKSC